MLCEEKYTVLEYEASAFVPYLILKVMETDCFNIAGSKGCRIYI